MGNCVMLRYGSGEKKKRNKEVDVSYGSSRKPFVNQNPNIKAEEMRGGGGGQEKERVVRMKVVLTKAEAEKLLAMGINDPEKMLQHLANELGRLDTGGMVGIGTNYGKNRSDAGVWIPVLESIPETV